MVHFNAAMAMQSRCLCSERLADGTEECSHYYKTHDAFCEAPEYVLLIRNIFIEMNTVASFRNGRRE
jgi:hypothetical protein